MKFFNKIVLFDTETTGVDTDDRLFELGYLALEDGAKVCSERFNPEKKISFRASAVTGVSRGMLEKLPSFRESTQFELFSGFARNRVLVAHNAKFDINILKNENIKIPLCICTLKLAKHLLDKDIDGEDLKSNSLQYLRFALGFDNNSSEIRHTVAGDVLVLKELFFYFVDILSTKFNYDEDALICEMLRLTNLPCLMKSLPFGKHRGVPMTEVPTSYLRWLKEDPQDKEADLIYTLDYYLEERRLELKK